MNEQSGCAGYVSVTLCVHAPLCHVSILFSVHSGCDMTFKTLYRVGKVPEILSMALLYRAREIHHSRTPSLTKSAMKRGRQRLRILQKRL